MWFPIIQPYPSCYTAYCKADDVTKTTQRPTPWSHELIERRIYLIRGQKVCSTPTCCVVAGANQGPEPGRPPKPRPVPGGLHAGIDKQGGCRSKVTICDLRKGTRSILKVRTLGLHGTRRRDAILRAQKQARRSDEHPDIRAFVKLREVQATHKDLARKMEDLERWQKEHGARINAVYEIVKRLIAAPSKPQRTIGFRTTM